MPQSGVASDVFAYAAYPNGPFLALAPRPNGVSSHVQIQQRCCKAQANNIEQHRTGHIIKQETTSNRTQHRPTSTNIEQHQTTCE
jgi:hypothetical protein